MAAGVALTKAKVTTPLAEYAKVGVLVRQNTATLRDGSVVVEQRDGVASVSQPDRTHWTVAFEDGSSWTVEKLKGCGCGR